MKKLLFVFGTRPEAIKMAPVINQFKGDQTNFKTYVAVTAQHREMLDQVLSIFKIKPDYDLNVMAQNQSLEKLTNNIILGVSEILDKVDPDIVFVQGDTTTTFASALASFYKKIRVAHIEAGLRTNNIYSPFPEEINRRMTSAISSLHFPPTKISQNNLLNEGIRSDTIKMVGNTVIDSLLEVSKNIDYENQKYNNYFLENYNINFNRKKIILVTGHRRESFGLGFENICYAIKHVAENNDVKIIYPVHLNPKVQDPVKKILSGISNIHLIPPLDYLPFIFLMKKSYIILTDSGGIQEEAPSLGKPVLIIRDTTERPEGIEYGTSKLVGTKSEKIISEINLLIKNKVEYDKMSKAISPYGDGDASLKIHKFIFDQL
tara:strand:- start:1821 stop:2948 length:1128 start_codon:yes stop_codon:yes gene_type:complete